MTKLCSHCRINLTQLNKPNFCPYCGTKIEKTNPLLIQHHRNIVNQRTAVRVLRR